MGKAKIVRVMDYPKFNFTRAQKEKFLRILLQIATIIDTKTHLDIADDPDDNMLIECAVEAGATHLISGDAHLKRLKKYMNINIMPVNDFLKEETNEG